MPFSEAFRPCDEVRTELGLSRVPLFTCDTGLPAIRPISCPHSPSLPRKVGDGVGVRGDVGAAAGDAAAQRRRRRPGGEVG